MRKYRTQEQFEEIVENCINGNWHDAAELCVKYGYYANDLIIKQDLEEDGIAFEDRADIALVVELAERIRFEDSKK